ncbi:hypothetical protein [Acinetobacter baumannii]|uniref:hypothetical protein n=1 Tax=Acinetobacter baumannii TaxID=470 RepID=UPI0022EAC9CF|nr:hypothetical protein [Acinetobacter baumannii]MDA3583510.1 hypothetical protein [Acinetobacter baumannii]MDN8378277.1 hypothetical protein [Acinetobacter baumannii]MDO7232322.1 hypothetical protein [Acinetobacter baumannii]
MDKKNFHWLILFVILFAVIAAWLSFPVFFEWLITKQFHIDPEKYGQKFGAVGDTYGSLNTLISSIALCAVAYSTWLQVTSLKETRESNNRQLELAKQSHDEQVKESQNAIFTAKFYGLLNLKNEKFHHLGIFINGEHKTAYDLFGELALAFVDLLEGEWQDVEKLDKSMVKKGYLDTIGKYEKTFAQIFSYFLIYGDILTLIKNSEQTEEDKKFFKTVLSNSMAGQEQMVIVWLGTCYHEINAFLKDSELIGQFYGEQYIPFVRKFHHESHFSPQIWKRVFDTKNPA